MDQNICNAFNRKILDESRCGNSDESVACCYGNGVNDFRRICAQSLAGSRSEKRNTKSIEKILESIRLLEKKCTMKKRVIPTKMLIDNDRTVR